MSQSKRVRRAQHGAGGTRHAACAAPGAQVHSLTQMHSLAPKRIYARDSLIRPCRFCWALARPRSRPSRRRRRTCWSS
jgi:hypothetical protein